MSWFKLYCLREKSTNKLLNVSYSQDGLMWTTDNLGRNIAGYLLINGQYKHTFSSTKAYNNILKQYTTIDSLSWEWNEDVYIDVWKHENHDTNKSGRIVSEIALKYKALALMYYSDYDPNYYKS